MTWILKVRVLNTDYLTKYSFPLTFCRWRNVIFANSWNSPVGIFPIRKCLTQSLPGSDTHEIICVNFFQSCPTSTMVAIRESILVEFYSIGFLENTFGCSQVSSWVEVDGWTDESTVFDTHRGENVAGRPTRYLIRESCNKYAGPKVLAAAYVPVMKWRK